MERSCFIIKPDAVAAGHTDAIISFLREKGFFIAKRRDVTVTRDLVRELYSHRSKEATFDKLLAYMISGPLVALVITKVGAVRLAQRLCGPKSKKEQEELDPAAAKPLRLLYGVDELRNAVHCSDSAAAAAREVALLFPTPALKDLSSQDYLAETLEPALNEFLQHVVKVRPADPYTACADWFRANRPRELDEEWFPEPVIAPGFAIKSDEWEGLHNELLLGKPSHAGIWNLHRAKGGLSLYAVGQCRSDGIAAVVEQLCHEPLVAAAQHVVWISVREEPVCFVHGMPVTLRESARLNEHVEHLAGIEGFEIAAMEERFMLELYERIAANGGKLQVYHQQGAADALVNEMQEMKVESSRCQTPAMVFSEMAAGGVNVELLRLPVGNEQPPQPKVIDLLVNALKVLQPKRSCVVVNDDHGVGRSTFMMCCAHIFFSVTQDHKVEPAQPIDRSSPNFPNYSNAEYKAVVELLGMLPSALLAKAFADVACDECGTLQNPRLQITECAARIATAKDGEARPPAFWKRQAEIYLIRYYYLVVFAAYVVEEHPLAFPHSFSGWMRRHWNLLRPLQRLVLQ